MTGDLLCVTYDDGPAFLNSPGAVSAMTIDGNGNLYFAVTFTSRVRMIAAGCRPANVSDASGLASAFAACGLFLRGLGRNDYEKLPFGHVFPPADCTDVNLEAIICWIARLEEGEQVLDLAGRKGAYQITTQQNGRKARFILMPGSARNVEVIAVRELLDQHGYKFRPLGE